MSQLTSMLTVKLIDDVSKPARSVAEALRDTARRAAEISKAMSEAGASNRFAASLSKLKLSAADINDVAKAWKDYQSAAGLARTASDWTKSQSTDVRRWEQQTVAALRNVKREQDAYRKRPAELPLPTRPGFISRASAVAGGFGVAGHLAQRPIEQGKEYGSARTNLMLSGMSHEQVEEAEAVAARLSSKYSTVARSSILDQIRSQTAVTGDFDHALGAIEDNVRLRMVAQMKRPGQNLDHEFELLNKAMEIAGVTSDPEKHKRYMDHIAKMQNFFGGTLGFHDIAGFIQHARSAGTGLSERFFAGIMPTLASEMHGDQAGTALATANSAIVGGRMKTASAETMMEYGLLDPKMVEYDKNKRIKRIQPGAVYGWQLFMSDPDLWAEQYLRPALTKKGKTSQEDMLLILQNMFSNRNAGDFFTKLLTQRQRLEKDAAGVAKAQGLESTKTMKDEDPGTGLSSVNTSFNNLLGTLSGPVLKTAIPALNALTAKLNGLADFAKSNPIAGGFAGTGALVGAGIISKMGLESVLGRLSGATALTGSATALTGSAQALTAAAGRLGGGTGTPLVSGATGGASGLKFGLSGLGILSMLPSLWYDLTNTKEKKLHDFEEQSDRIQDFNGMFDRTFRPQMSRQAMDRAIEVDAERRNDLLQGGQRLDFGQSATRRADASSPTTAEAVRAQQAAADDHFDALKAKAAETGESVKTSLSVTAAPQIDMGPLDTALAKANELRAVLAGIGGQVQGFNGLRSIGKSPFRGYPSLTFSGTFPGQ